MKVFGWVGVIFLATACNNTVPTATVYKEQLAQPAVVAPPNNSGNATAGDSAKGQAALTANCAVCHTEAGTPGHKLVAADAEKVKPGGAASKNPAHAALQGVLDAIKNSGNDMAAALGGASTSTAGTSTAGAGDAAKGTTLLANCTGCHVAGGTGPVLTSAITSLADAFDLTELHAPLADYFAGQNEKDILAALKTK